MSLFCMSFKGYAVLLFLFVFSLSFASAGATCLTVTSKSISDYMNEIPSLNSQLTNCKITVQSNVHSLVGDGNVFVNVDGNHFYGTIQNQVLTGITSGKPTSYSYEVQMSSATFTGILSSTNALDEVLKSVNNRDIKIIGNGFWNQMKWFFAKWFLPKPGAGAGAGGGAGTGTGGGANVNQGGPTGKPDYCDDTYLPGHRGYAENKDTWDGYSANTDKVCQSQYGKGIPSPCIHTVQLSVSGNPYYLCWYNE
jgi:hypothetical protein